MKKELGKIHTKLNTVLHIKPTTFSQLLRRNRNDHSTILHEVIAEALETADDIVSCTNSTPSGSI